MGPDLTVAAAQAVAPIPPPRPVRRGLAVRATLLILLFGGVIGAVVAWFSAVLIERTERDRLNGALVELMSTVERAASVAAFAGDAQLATEVVIGLLNNRSIAQAVIEDSGIVLAAAGGPDASPVGLRQPLALSQPLHSPFDDTEVIGQLRIVPAVEVIARDAASYSRFIALILAIEVVLITLGVSWVVTRGVTRPIRTLSDDLHRLDAEGGAHVAAPRGYEHDEIGRLAEDINGLIDRMAVSLVSERRARELHAAAERKWRLIFHNAETGLCTIDAGGRLSDWNPWLARLLNLPLRDDREGRFILGERFVDAEGHFAHMLGEAALGRPLPGADFECRDSSGYVRWLNVVLNPLEGSPGMLQGIINDVTERKRAEALARTQAERDALTGLLNRRGVEKVYGAAARESREAAGLCLLMFDLDGFKAVNDTHGHEAGDELLKLVARRVESIVRRSDKVARIGGDEFVVLLERLNSISMARQIAGKLVDLLAQPFAVSESVLVTIGASVGVAYTHCPPAQLAELLRRADGAMYEAKKGGKSQYRFAFPT